MGDVRVPACQPGPLPGRALGREVFARPATEVARDLVGSILVRADEGLAARIVETEAYTEDDPACHGHRGRTEANAALFGPPGTAYVYRSYGIHWLCNVATAAAGEADGVLLRAAEPLAGWELIRTRRGSRVPDRDLLRGPGRLAQAFGLDGSWNGQDLCGPPPAALHLRGDDQHPERVAGPRVGIARAADWPRRWHVPGSRWVSPYQRNPRAREPQGSG
ncbi:DNA-3-methyladenine glycosylase [Egibacter rhizosphaerae]|uniref:Putative 3-methyladenine DNA glycosylase n=1 Tax=Egibacter rhizosphaerae TaxID=1670831 RepID=A0A411YK57_9ACTN|nr:DNA-3-methyladenine glycosylase [Egibacter rhizosphaerae]QBI21576.1 DNA-3-methyladenine glycosylase [Egibacter rhizosphaerae]